MIISRESWVDDENRIQDKDSKPESDTVTSGIKIRRRPVRRNKNGHPRKVKRFRQRVKRNR